MLTIPARDILISILLRILVPKAETIESSQSSTTTTTELTVHPATADEEQAAMESLREPLLENETMVPQQDETELVDAPASFRLRPRGSRDLFFERRLVASCVSSIDVVLGFIEAVFDSVAFDTVCVVLVISKSR
jgi:hypothetical protein